MDKTRLPQRCRACLETSEKMYPLVGPVLNVEVDIANMISYCTSSKMELSEDLPDGICLPCFKMVRIAYNFIHQFKESQEKLITEQEVMRKEGDFNKAITYSISEDGTELIEETMDYSTYDMDFGDRYVDDVDEHVVKIEPYYDNPDISTKHSSIENKIQSVNSNGHHENKDSFMSEVMYRIKNEVCEAYDNAQTTEETDSDYLTQYMDDSAKLSDDIRAVLTDMTDSASLDKFIIVNESDDNEVEKEETSDVDKQLIEGESIPKCSYTCPLCDSHFYRFLSFNDHLLLHKEKTVVCNRCPGEVELNMSQYIQHYKEEHRYQCYICGKSLMSSYGYRYHMTQHKNVKRYKCPTLGCSKSFIFVHLLKKHMRTHSDVITYTCNLCKATFKTYDTYRYHQKTHDGQRNHLCTFCGQAFFQAVHLRDHMYRHVGIKRFTCDTCGRSFTTNSQLKKHFKHCNKPKRIST